MSKVILLIIGCLALVAAYSVKYKKLTPSSNIKIGVVAPFTGAAAELGTQIKNGIELARLDLTQNVEFYYEDSSCDPSKALTAVRKLVSIEKVSLIIGPLCSPAFLTVSPFLNKAKIPFIHTSSGTENTSANKGDYGIEATATVMDENEKLSEHILSLGYQTAAIIHFEQEWATGHSIAFTNSYQKRGGKIVSKQSFTNPLDTDFRSLILKISIANPEALFIAAFNQQSGTIVKQLRSYGIQIPIFSQYDIEDSTFLKAAAGTAEGLQYTYPFDHLSLSNEGISFIHKYKEKFNVYPSFYPFNGFDITQLVFKSLKKCSAVSECLMKELKKTKNFQGLTGELTLDKAGTIKRNFIIKTVINNSFKKIQ